MILEIQGIHRLLTKPETSKIVYILLHWFQHVAGTTFPIFEHLSYSLDYVNSIWLRDLIRLLSKYKVSLHLKKKIPSTTTIK